MHNTNNNYPTPFAYFLAGMVRVYMLFADPHNFYEFWINTNYPFLIISKMPSIIADFGIAALFIWFGKKSKQLGFPSLPMTSYVILALCYVFNPIAIMDGAWWGQVDSIGVLIFLLALASSLYKKPYLAGFIYITAVMTKLQNMIYGPLFMLFIWQTLGFGGMIKTLFGGTTAFILLNIEFFLARDMRKVFNSLTLNYDYFPYMSLNAYNFWWIVAKADGMHMSDKLLMFGILNAKTVGLYLFTTTYLLAALTQARQTIQSMLRFAYTSTKHMQQIVSDVLSPLETGTYLATFFISLSIAVFGFFLFQTESHDRYAFPLTVFILLTTPFLPYNKRRAWLIGYWIWTGIYFYNLHSAFSANYPHNTFPILSTLLYPWMTTTAAILHVSIFLLFLWVIRSIITFPVFAISGIVLSLLLIAGNIPYWMNKPIPLTMLTPWAKKQEFGKAVFNMPTNAAYGPKTWDNLSNQYYFYRKGIGTHALSKLAYDLDGKFSTFSTDYGIDTEAGPQGSAIFEIWGDSKRLFKSELMGRYDKPKHIKINVEDIKTLELITTDGGNGNTDDHTDWLNPMLYR